jgi:hypothetical protein
MLSQVLDAAKSIILGKTQGAEADPMVLGLWVIASGFFAMAVAFARRENKGGATIVCALVATVMASGLIARGLMPPLGPGGAPGSGPTKQPTGGTGATGGAGTGRPVSVDAFSTLVGISLGGASIVTIGNTSNVAACEQACRSNNECVAYTFDQPTSACQLKRQPGNRIEFKGSTSGVREKRP